VPLAFGAQTWTHEVASVVLPSRLQELRTPRPPTAEVTASDTEGVSMNVRFCPSLALRDGATLPVPGARYQLSFAKIPHGSKELDESSRWEWKEHLPVLENCTQPSVHEIEYRARDLLPGGTYIFSVRLGDNHRWSSWSQASEPVLLGVPAPIPSPGDVLEISCDTGASSAVRLEWRPFRTGMNNLSCVEYKVMSLEWPFEESSKGNDVLARLRRAANESQSGPAHDIGQRTFNAAGYVLRQSLSGAQLRAVGDRIEWKTDGLRAGRYYRFFVCARYACLPLGAMLPPPAASASASAESTESKALMWPDEHCEHVRSDGLAWEASLSRCGLWSPVVNTGHIPQYHVPPLLQPGPSPMANVPALSQSPGGLAALQMSGQDVERATKESPPLDVHERRGA